MLAALERTHAFFSDDWTRGFPARDIAQRTSSSLSGAQTAAALRALMAHGLVAGAADLVPSYDPTSQAVRAARPRANVYSLTSSGAAQLRAWNVEEPLRCPVVAYPKGFKTGSTPHMLEESRQAYSICIDRARPALYALSETLCPGYRSRAVCARLMPLERPPSGDHAALRLAIADLLACGFLPDGMRLTTLPFGGQTSATQYDLRVSSAFTTIDEAVAGVRAVESDDVQLALAALDADLYSVQAAAEQEIITDGDVFTATFAQTIAAGASGHHQALRDPAAAAAAGRAFQQGTYSGAWAAGAPTPQPGAPAGPSANPTASPDPVAKAASPLPNLPAQAEVSWVEFKLTTTPIISLPFTGSLGGQLQVDGAWAVVEGLFTARELKQIVGLLGPCVRDPVDITVIPRGADYGRPSQMLTVG